MRHDRPLVHDLAVVIVSIPGQPHWLDPCLRSIAAHRGDVALDVVVVENDGSGEAARIVDGLHARVVTCPNRGFAHGNNQALHTVDARHVLFLNPDTEVRDGTFAGLVAEVDARPGIGAAGGRQVLPDGTLFPTVRRFPTALTALGTALGAERLPPHWLPRVRERELDLSLYDAPLECDWVSGSFLLVRREALEAAGWFDERFFLYSEETDLCRRIKAAGWDVVHLPTVTITHHIHAGAGVDERMLRQFAYSSRLYAGKHLSPAHRRAFLAALALAAARRGRWSVVRTLAGRGGPPFAPVPDVAVSPPAGPPAIPPGPRGPSGSG